jgi:hypothetical protein
MRLSTFILLPLLSQVFAQEKHGKAEKFDYQSDVARLRKIVIESLYSVSITRYLKDHVGVNFNGYSIVTSSSGN